MYIVRARGEAGRLINIYGFNFISCLRRLHTMRRVIINSDFTNNEGTLTVTGGRGVVTERVAKERKKYLLRYNLTR